jgi:hypothetical protein
MSLVGRQLRIRLVAVARCSVMATARSPIAPRRGPDGDHELRQRLGCAAEFRRR